MPVLSTHQQLVGGIRLEIRIRTTHVLDAVNHVLERQQFDPHQFGVNCQYNKVPVQRYLVYAEGLFRTARAIFTRSGVMRHAGAREMTNIEKRIFAWRPEVTAWISSLWISHCARKRKLLRVFDLRCVIFSFSHVFNNVSLDFNSFPVIAVFIAVLTSFDTALCTD